MRAGRDAVRLAASHQGREDRGVHPRIQVFAVEDRGDAAHDATARIALDRLAGERLPDIGRVALLQALRELDDGVGARAARDGAVDRVDARVRLVERAEEVSSAFDSDPEVHHDTGIGGAAVGPGYVTRRCSGRLCGLARSLTRVTVQRPL
jgi:hypothetical protein